MITNRRKSRRLARSLTAAVGVISLALIGAACSSSGGSGGSGGPGTKGSGYTIALSNSFTGNNWRKVMVQAWTEAAQAAQKQGIIKSFKIVNTPDNSATEQIAQINSLILQHVDAITIDAASGTALNSVIQTACSKGIKIIVFDSLASAPCEYNMLDDVKALGTTEAQTIATAINGKGNVVVVRGVVGSAPELIDYNAQLAVLKKYPGIKIVATVIGHASASQTQQALESVLPSLPKINGVVDDGVGEGVYEAFVHAGLPVPAFDLGADGQSLLLFQQLHKKNGLNGAAIEVDPGMGSAAFWEAVDLLKGQKFNGAALPKNVNVPLVTVTPDNLDAWVAVTAPTSVAHWVYTKADADNVIAANITSSPLPIPPVPTVPGT